MSILLKSPVDRVKEGSIGQLSTARRPSSPGHLIIMIIMVNLITGSTDFNRTRGSRIQRLNLMREPSALLAHRDAHRDTHRNPPAPSTVRRETGTQRRLRIAEHIRLLQRHVLISRQFIRLKLMTQMAIVEQRLPAPRTHHHEHRQRQSCTTQADDRTATHSLWAVAMHDAEYIGTIHRSSPGTGGGLPRRFRLAGLQHPLRLVTAARRGIDQHRTQQDRFPGELPRDHDRHFKRVMRA